MEQNQNGTGVFCLHRLFFQPLYSIHPEQEDLCRNRDLRYTEFSGMYMFPHPTESTGVWRIGSTLAHTQCWTVNLQQIYWDLNMNVDSTTACLLSLFTVSSCTGLWNVWFWVITCQGFSLPRWQPGKVHEPHSIGVLGDQHYVLQFSGSKLYGGLTAFRYTRKGYGGKDLTFELECCWNA